ncbi:hypothetical protein, partial [Streptomyces sp. NPDC055140]
MDAGFGAARLGEDLPRGADECLAGLGMTAFESVPAWRASARPSLRATILMNPSFLLDDEAIVSDNSIRNGQS